MVATLVNWIEMFIDTHGELPQFDVASSELPNENLTTPFNTRTKSALKQIKLKFPNHSWKNFNRSICYIQSRVFPIFSFHAL